ncbi:Radical SAM domain protein [Coriobacterium glomerans PW2]|uniref:Radical SAM domain protein n=1 Tax=Coriobacterium glomerans (strain ATCC 49209 / DSM 20642 / JCM 10262 / PW2) TaxID=700015 RepID=F2NBA4_CORGP|nr:radical SAM protein [Coriobacterium glomerans]AEB06640.1 Radical SAM domain protein [Coriobacterium glomerans PW2]
MKATDQIKRAALNKTMDYLLENPDRNLGKIMDMVDKVVPADFFASQRKAMRTAIEGDNNWHDLLLRVLDLNPQIRDSLLKMLVVDANLMAWPRQEAMREKYRCNIPWTVLMDPTSACNLHCTGCWAAEYGAKENLTLEELDSIIEQGCELGTHVYIYTGGEPLVRKRDLIEICERHPDCAFLAFTNATLIDEEFCQEMLRVKNFVPAISVEGFEEATDARRGAGTYRKVRDAMRLLAAHGLPFGVSCCYTSENADSIASEEFFDWMIEQGALFCWVFTFMPIGADAPTELMASAEQRERLYHFMRDMRTKKPLFTIDFWNDGEFVGGCIAGGRRYLHINAAGDVEPCVFAHYANANIRETSLLDALRSPLFMAYYEGQPFNDNLLRPCPILDNPGRLAEMVQRTGAHSTDLEHHEDASVLCAKCERAARAWESRAERLWRDPGDPMHDRRNSPGQGMSEADMHKLERLERAHPVASDARKDTAAEREAEPVS